MQWRAAPGAYSMVRCRQPCAWPQARQSSYTGDPVIHPKRSPMKFAIHAVFHGALLVAAPVFAAPPAPASAPTAAHVAAVQTLLGAMQAEKILQGVAARSKYPNDAQRQAVFAKLNKTPPATVYARLAPPLASAISAETAGEMTRFYTTPYGRKVIQQRYNSAPQISMPGMRTVVTPEEKQERKRAAYVQASKELAAAEPAIEHEAFKLVQSISKEK